MTDHTARELEPTVARPIIDRLDPSLAPGCYGSSFCFHEDAPECMSCPFINTCRPLAAESMAAIGAKYGVVPKVHKDPLDAHGRHFEVVEPPNEEVSAEQAWNREELSGWRSWELKKRADRDGKRAEREAKKEDQRAAEQARAKGAVTIVNAIRAEAKSRLALLKRATAAEHLNKSLAKIEGNEERYVRVWVAQVITETLKGRKASRAEIADQFSRTSGPISRSQVRTALERAASFEEQGIWTPFKPPA